jgi:hypothetical protein
MTETAPGGPQDVAEALAALLEYAMANGVYLGRRLTRRDARGVRYGVGTFRPPNQDRWTVRWAKDGWITEREAQ